MMTEEDYTGDNFAEVSVPYWGSLSSNLVLAEDFVNLVIVSVPYWGSLSSNRI